MPFSPPSVSASAPSADPPAGTGHAEPLPAAKAPWFLRWGGPVALLLALAAGVWACFWACGSPMPGLSEAHRLQQDFQSLYERHPVGVALGYGLVFTLLTALCLPGAALLLLVSGASFGLVWGSLIGVLASSAGATLTMLGARRLFRERALRHVGPRWAPWQARIERDSGWILLSLRLAPVLPFVALNLVAGLTALGAWRFFWISALGMLPGTVVYVHAGRELAAVRSLADLGSPPLLLALGLLALLPWAGRWLRERLARPGSGQARPVR